MVHQQSFTSEYIGEQDYGGTGCIFQFCVVWCVYNIDERQYVLNGIFAVPFSISCILLPISYVLIPYSKFLAYPPQETCPEIPQRSESGERMGRGMGMRIGMLFITADISPPSRSSLDLRSMSRSRSRSMSTSTSRSGVEVKLKVRVEVEGEASAVHYTCIHVCPRYAV